MTMRKIVSGRTTVSFSLTRCIASYWPLQANEYPDGSFTLSRTDRKSTRLNSSHLVISYAVFCLKKKRYSRRLWESAHPRPRAAGGGPPRPWAAAWPCVFFFFFNDTATTEIYTLSLHDALPIYRKPWWEGRGFRAYGRPLGDRKSTRLNSSHLVISYAVFCLKKKKRHTHRSWCEHEHRACTNTGNEGDT